MWFFPLSLLCQIMMVWVHLSTRRSTSLQTIPLLCHPLLPPIKQTQQWASCRPSPPHWPQALTPVLIYTRNPPIPPSPHTLPRTTNMTATAVVEAKQVAPSLTPALSRHHHHHYHLPLRSTPLPPSHLCSTVEHPKKNRWHCVRLTGWRWSSLCHRRKRKEMASHIHHTYQK